VVPQELAQRALDQEYAFADWEVEDYAEASQAPITAMVMVNKYCY